MNSRLILGVVSATTWAIGVLVGYYAAINHLEATYQRDLEDFKKFTLGKKAEIKVDGSGTEVVIVKDEGERLNELLEPYRSEEDDEPPFDSDEEDEEILPDESNLVGEQKKEYPYLITEEGFYHEHEEYSKTDLYYYRADSMFCDMNDNLIPTEEAEVFVATTSHLKQLKRMSTIYVRNDMMATDFAIYSNKGSYQRDVLNRVEDPSERTKRLAARKRSAKE